MIFGDPANWGPVLDQYPKLRIDFAHFGNNGANWAEKIVDLMERPGNNIFTDLACYTDPEKLKTAKAMLKANPILKKRLMFGTDFDVMLLTDFIDLQGYFDRFNPAVGKIFSEEEMDAMSRDVPRSFLNRERPAVAGETRAGRRARRFCFPADRPRSA